jgi:outer membrane receptor protein involved in Fe transport
MDEQYFTLFNDPEALEPSRDMINLRIRFEPSSAALENVSFTAFVNNVSDEEYANGYVLSGFTGAVNNTFGPPRTWGVQINYATN